MFLVCLERLFMWVKGVSKTGGVCLFLLLYSSVLRGNKIQQDSFSLFKLFFLFFNIQMFGIFT